LPHVHLVFSLLKRWILGTFQGSVSHKYLEYYLDEYTFRFNRRKSRSRGKLFRRIVEKAVVTPPATRKEIKDHLIKPDQTLELAMVLRATPPNETEGSSVNYAPLSHSLS
jgi:hypothetical protein